LAACAGLLPPAAAAAECVEASAALEAPAPLALLAGLACVILVRAAISANNFAMSRRFGSPTPPAHRLTARRGIALFAEEFKASMLATSWFLPRGRPFMRIHPGGRVPPVLLLHGYGCNSGYWVQVGALLERERISHAAIDLEPLTASIDDYLPQVARAVEALCAATGEPEVLIVAHSMGGLVARAYLRRHGADRIAHIYTLGSPHHGTALADLGPGRNAEQMRCLAGGANPWLAQLAAAETPATRALITSIYSHHDNIVTPQTSSMLAGARNVELSGIGHVALGSNARVLTLLLDEIARQCTRQNNVWQR
jgi:triacylglycerol esterase/lipase EstA (alpha/beta hydrolase family)